MEVILSFPLQIVFLDRCAYILESFDRLNVQVDLKSFGCPKHPANCLSNMRSERELTPTRLVKMIYLRPVILINYKSQKIAGINFLDTNSVCNFSFHFLCRFENILLHQNTSSNQTKKSTIIDLQIADRQILQQHKHCVDVLQKTIKSCICTAQITNIEIGATCMRGKIHWLCIYDWDRTHDLLLTRQALPIDYLSKSSNCLF